VRISEDVMVVDPDRGVLAALASDAAPSLGPLLAKHAEERFEGAVVKLTTSARETVEEAIGEVTLLRAELAATLASRHGLAAAAAGLHPWSEASAPRTLAPLRPRPMTEVAGILGRLDPMCGLRVAVALPDSDRAVRALDGLRLQVPLIVALSANSPFWRGRYTGLASTRTVLRTTGCPGGLPRGFGSYANYVAAIDALITAGKIPGASSVDWDARLQPELGVLELTVMDSQTRIAEVAALAALVQCLARLNAERGDPGQTTIPELVLENRAAAAQKGMRARLIDAAGHFTHSAIEELALLVDACAPVARRLGCARELAYVHRLAADAGHVRQRTITASAGLGGLVTELIRDFADAPYATRASPRSDDAIRGAPS
jgi:carboxylate-amine ligase